MTATTSNGISADVKAKYEILEVIGSGSFGTVRKCKDKKTGELLAVKSICKARVDHLDWLHREISILQSVKHPHIIQLYETFEDDTNVHIVTELCTGGELFDKVLEMADSPQGHFREEDAAILIRDILDAIRYCHDVAKIVHRDLKPENFLLKDESPVAFIKIIDFGLSRKDPQGIMESRVGSPYYVAPEVLQNSYTSKCDIWSIGVISYILLCGYCPYAGDTDIETLQMVQYGKLDFPSPEWDTISEDAKDFIQNLLQRDEFLRPTAAQALDHPWIAPHVVPPGLPKPRPFREESFTKSAELHFESERRSAFQKLLASLKVHKTLEGIGNLLTPTEATALVKLFQKVDDDQDGDIDVDEIDRAVQNESFSQSVRTNLQQLHSTLVQYPKLSLNFRPLLAFCETKSQKGSGSNDSDTSIG